MANVIGHADATSRGRTLRHRVSRDAAVRTRGHSRNGSVSRSMARGSGALASDAVALHGPGVAGDASASGRRHGLPKPDGPDRRDRALWRPGDLDLARSPTTARVRGSCRGSSCRHTIPLAVPVGDSYRSEAITPD